MGGGGEWLYSRFSPRENGYKKRENDYIYQNFFWGKRLLYSHFPGGGYYNIAIFPGENG